MKVFLRTPAAQFPSGPWARRPELRSERGIALVVTLILLSVITFLTVAFLFLATREKGAVANTVDMAVSRRADEAAVENAKAQILASVMSSNQFYYRMIVSTNYFNTNGFTSSSTSLTNVNYDFLSVPDGGGTNFSIDQRNQNIANLYYASRPPVFVPTNRDGRGEFRFYLDLNQNGRFDTNGLMIEIGNRGTPLLALDANGNTIPVTNFFVGDPEWVGVLERPDRPHSASNKFVARWCYIAVPTGKTLDINTLHNQAKFPVSPAADGFLRNMGVGPWEMNLASFLVDLNTNVWQRNPAGPGSLPPAFINPTPYFYDTTLALPSTGTAFDDAVALTRYRYNGNWNNLKSIAGLFGTVGATAIQRDGADDYSAGPLLLTNTTPIGDGDLARTGSPWPGAENLNHFFTTQDLLDSKKTRGTLPTSFSDRLFYAGYFANSSYDRYTFYRLLSQMGMDTPPDPTLTNKINLNYLNVDSSGNVVPDYQTNFIPWSSALQFFTNSADRLLRATFTDTNANFTNFGVASVISFTNIPVLVSNRFVYSPSVQRVLQVTANIWDSTTNRAVAGTLGYLPTVFRPTFRLQKNPINPAIDDVYINGYVEVDSVPGLGSDPQFSPPLDLSDPVDVAKIASPPTPVVNVYGVPWIIGAKKGLPNFNEFAMQSVSQITRKLQLRRPNVNSRPNTTNQLFVVGVSNVFAIEGWNSYAANYSNAVQMIVANDMTLGFNYTNDVPLDPRGGASAIRLTVSALTNLTKGPNTEWRGYGRRVSSPEKKSFIVPLQTNITFLPDSFFRLNSAPAFTTNMDTGSGLYKGFEQTGQFPIPQFTFAVSNRVRFILIDMNSKRVIDYVQLNDANGLRNLSAEVTETDDGGIFVDGSSGVDSSERIFWQTNRIGANSLQGPPMGVINQIEASLGNINVPDWNSFGIGQASGQSKLKEIAAFKDFMLGTGTNIEMQAPFTPTRKTSQYITWQANDPLVHYMVGDLADLSLGTGIKREWPNGPLSPIKNIGTINDRFQPWGGNPVNSTLHPKVPLYSLETKDPGVGKSDDWDFPTNKFGTVGLLGRVHRGSPWQTIYLKANDVDMGQWTNWTGNANFLDASMNRPVMDRLLVDVFTTAIDQNSTRGQLNINQSGIAAWSALLGGVIGLTNSSTDDQLYATPPQVNLQSFIIDPAGADPAGVTNSTLGRIHDAVDRTRAAAPFNGSFKQLGDILAVPELTTASPLLNTNSAVQLQKGISDAVYERLPQQLLGLMRGGDQPSFTVYAYGQALHPANHSIVTSGPFFGLCTNYQITAEFATRSVVRIEGAPKNPKAVVDSFNVLSTE